jgi:hypothetical protein
MLKVVVLYLSMVCVNLACAENEVAVDCVVGDSVVTHLEVASSKIVSEVSGIDENSQENTMTHQIQFDNGDVVNIVQKYCDMYNVSINYKLKVLNKGSFRKSIESIDSLISILKIDYTLKAPLANVVDMTMNQNQFSIDQKFEYDLPVQAVNSKSYVEHTVSFSPVSDYKDFKAELNYYIGLGGE